MYLLYLDDSGSAENPTEQYLVLGGICVYERQVQHFTHELDKIAERLVPGKPETVEFHASEVFSGRVEPWKALNRDQRRDLIREVLGVLANAYDSARAFATIVHKASFAPKHPMEVAFEDICSRFDRFLRRVDAKGLIILDESTHATGDRTGRLAIRTPPDALTQRLSLDLRRVDAIRPLRTAAPRIRLPGFSRTIMEGRFVRVVSAGV